MWGYLRLSFAIDEIKANMLIQSPHLKTEKEDKKAILLLMYKYSSFI